MKVRAFEYKATSSRAGRKFANCVFQDLHLDYLALIVRSSTIWKTLSVRFISALQGKMLWSFLISAAVLLMFMVSFPGRVTWVNFASYVPLVSQNPRPLKSIS